jgi:hypothetical protein
MKLTKREIAGHREGEIRMVVIYVVENLPPGHNAIIIKVMNDWRVLYSESGVDSEWEDRYVSADAALEALEWTMGPAAAHRSDHVLDLYVLGRLTADEDATVTTHVEACEECQEQVAETIKLIQDLRLEFMQDDKLNDVQLQELCRKLSVMSVTAVMDAYRSAYFQCKLDGDKVPSARAIQTLVQVWREMRGWSKRR